MGGGSMMLPLAIKSEEVSGITRVGRGTTTMQTQSTRLIRIAIDSALTRKVYKPALSQEEITDINILRQLKNSVHQVELEHGYAVDQGWHQDADCLSSALRARLLEIAAEASVIFAAWNEQQKTG